MKHSDYITHIKNEEDIPFLKSKLFDVNMRLFETSARYRFLILDMCRYIRWLAEKEKEGYKKPHGMSGANAGLPFNIIGIVRNRNHNDEKVEIMINPKILEAGGGKTFVKSNCGSLTLPKPIDVWRYDKVKVGWFNMDGQYKEADFGREHEGFTIQHEIDHNLGILITDK
jgi:peptide deformylase